MKLNSLSTLPFAVTAALVLAPTALAQDGATLGQGTDDAAAALERSILKADNTDRISGTGSSYRKAPASKYVVRPITAPNYSEDPYITTDVRGTYVTHTFPSNTSFNGTRRAFDFHTYDFQGRYALSDDLQIMVSKLGAAELHRVGPEEVGLTDLALGVKYSLLSDWKAGTHVAVGAGFELGIGDEDVFGDDSEFRIFGAYGKNFENFNFSASANAIFATGSEDLSGDSDSLFLNLHLDYALNEMVSPVVELNYFKTLSEGDNVTPVSGVDIANFGGNEDEDVMTIGLGGELRIIEDVAMRLTYETPLTDSEDLFGYRWTASAVWTF